MSRVLSIIYAGLISISMALGAQADDRVTERLKDASLAYFLEQSHPQTGLIYDRAPAASGDSRSVASVAATGFGLTAYAIAAGSEMSEKDAYDRCLLAMRTIYAAPTQHGFYYHFIDPSTSERTWQSEVSSIDTALLVAGALTARARFPNTEVAKLATEVYNRVEWAWMLDGGTSFSMGWTPEGGFLPHRWDHFSEHMLLEILAMGSPTHPVDPKVWDAWDRGPREEFNGESFMQYPPLFVHQYSHAWIDFRNVRDNHADYWRNSVVATLAHRQMFMDLSHKFPHYGPSMWGLTSSDSPTGYVMWGGPKPTPNIDGSIVPCAAGGSIPFAPAECLSVLAEIDARYGDKAWTRYGFVDAFNPQTGWYSKDAIGINVGIIYLMIRNHQDDAVWKLFMKNPEIGAAMSLAGFVAG